MDVPENAPTSCPGISSETAGKMSACAGCPNQAACSSGAAKLSLEEREPEVMAQIRKRFSGVKRVLFVLSGKGGVGKSSVSVCLARGLSSPSRGFNVGLLDLDLCGPSIPCLMGCLEGEVHQSAEGWSPVFVTDRLALMSLGFLTTPDQAIIWRGPRKNAFIRDLLCKVAWTGDAAGDEDPLDFLLIDTPPGTSDEHLSSVPYIKASEVPCAALIVTTPQELALCDVRKQINFCEKIGLPVLGVVENMTSFECPCCGVSSGLFPASTGGADSLCRRQNDPLKVLGRIPLDPRLTRCLDEGGCPFETLATDDGKCSKNLHSGLPVIKAFSTLMDSIISNFP